MRSTFFSIDVNNSIAAMCETGKLIELVRERPFLYDMNDPEYKNRVKRQATWKEIAIEMGSGSGESWSSKWKGLKDNYAKYKKSSEPPYDENYKKYKNWPWVEHVRFLDECNFTSGRRVRYTTCRAPIADVNTEDSNDAEQEMIKKLGRKRRNETFDEDQESSKVRRENNPSPDGVDQFFLSYAQSFKKLPSRMQIMLKLDIATLFSRYELQADGVNPDAVDSMPRVVPHPVKLEYDLFNTIDD